jgi:hypothetical protein
MANLGDLGDAIYAKNEEISAANAKVEELQQEKKILEDQLLSAMQEAKTSIIRGQVATISITEQSHPQIVDLEKLYKFVLRRKALHLFQRRIAVEAYRELKVAIGNKPIPGTTEFTQTKLSVRKIAKG